MRLAPAAVAVAMASVGFSGACSGDCDRPICPDDITEPDPGSPWDVEQSFALGGGELVEAWIAMSGGRELVVEFESAPRGVTWDVHSHIDMDEELVEQHESGFDSALTLQFVAPTDNDFFVLFENRADDELSMTVRIQLAAGDRFVEWL